MLQRRKRYKNRTILGYKTLAAGSINMAEVRAAGRRPPSRRPCPTLSLLDVLLGGTGAPWGGWTRAGVGRRGCQLTFFNLAFSLMVIGDVTFLKILTFLLG